MARPKLDIDPEQVRRLASIGAPTTDIAWVLGCSVDTIERRFKQEVDEGRANGRVRLRQKQLEIAMSGNAAMLIWLGKQMLGQTDKQELRSEVNGDSTIRLNWGSKNSVVKFMNDAMADSE